MAATAKPQITLGTRCVAAGILSDSQLELAVREQSRRGGRLDHILVELNLVSGERLSDFLAREAGSKFVELGKLAIDKAALESVPIDLARRFRVVPISRLNGTLTVAMADPLNVVAIDMLHQLTGLPIDVFTATERDILNFLDEIASPDDTTTIRESIDQIIQQEADEAREGPVPDTAATAEFSESDAPIIRLVSQIIARAVNIGASDIHFEPEEKLMRIRVRLDGLLHPDVLIPKSLQSAVTARLKILAEMDVAESRLPQDGRATVFVGRRQINLRVSSHPTSYGESVVIRILDPSSQILKLASLGMAPPVEHQLRNVLDAPHGVVIVTGPTGSGKTTTLYAALSEISTSEYSVFTLEDPIEFRLAGLRQTQIKEEIGLTFSNGLRALLRQDPDVILVGETRDTETAQLMVRAALTGHLVFTTLHTNDAAGAIPRLIDMGVEPYLLPESLIAVLAQRLVRRVCARCKAPVTDPERVFAELDVPLPPGQPINLWRGTGCDACQHDGFRGRQGLFELMRLNDTFHTPIVRRSGAPEYQRLAREAGMQTMFEDGVRHVLRGTTTLEELLRVTRASESAVVPANGDDLKT